MDAPGGEGVRDRRCSLGDSLTTITGDESQATEQASVSPDGSTYLGHKLPVGEALVSSKSEDYPGCCGEESDDGKYEHSDNNTNHNCRTSVRANRVKYDLHKRKAELARRTVEHSVNVECNVEHSQKCTKTENTVQDRCSDNAPWIIGTFDLFDHLRTTEVSWNTMGGVGPP